MSGDSNETNTMAITEPKDLKDDPSTTNSNSNINSSRRGTINTATVEEDTSASSLEETEKKTMAGDTIKSVEVSESADAIVTNSDDDDDTDRVHQDKLGVSESSLEDRANCLSQWTLGYLSPLLRLGASKVLEQDDVGVPSREDRASRAFEVAQKTWTEEVIRINRINEKRKAKYDARLNKMSEERRKKAAPFVKTEPSVYRALVRGFGGWKIALAMFYYTVGALLTFVPVLILEDLVKFFESGGTTDNYDGYAHPWVEVAALLVVPVFVSLLQTRHFTIMAHCAVFVRTAVSTLVYQKALTVSASGRARTSSGQVVNIMSNDTTQLQRFLQFCGMFVVAPFQIILSLVLIYQQVGNATWVGVGFILFLAPVNMLIFSVVGNLRRKVLQYSDLRVKMMNEILSGIRVIKFYAWEKPFRKEIGKLRGSELKALTKLAYVTAFGFSLILMSAPIVQPILVFLTYIEIQSEPLTASKAFTTVALFNIMRFPFAFLPMGMLQLIQSRVSLRRVCVYLQLPELSDYVLPIPHPDDADDPDAPGSQAGSVTMKHAAFSWIDPNAGPVSSLLKNKKKRKKHRRSSRRRSSNGDLGSTTHSVGSVASVGSNATGGTDAESDPMDRIALRNITCTVEAGSLVAVVGSVGSGKSSFLSAILGEMESVEDSKVCIPRNDGDEKKSNFVSYCTQTPWVVNDTVKGNILFGRRYDEDRYKKVVKACALLDDLAVLPAGDMTEIGERGINLSGGQKARVSLARAMYSTETKLLLLDDPLSAVDAHVGEHLFKEAITGDVAAGTTRILVTHHVHFLPRCDSVIVLEDGKIAHHGTYEDLVEDGVDFAGAVDVSKVENDSDEAHAQGAEGTDEPNAEVIRKEETKEDGNTDASASKQATTTSEADLQRAEMLKSGKKLVKDEEREEGEVSGSAYIHYAQAGGVILALSVLVIQALGRGSEVMASFWLAIWSDASVQAARENDPLTTSETKFYLNIYAAFGMLGVLCLTLRAVAMAVHRLYASKKLHEDLTYSIMRAPVAFFDVTPTGRILNRFAYDMDKIDLQISQSLSQAINTLYSVLGALGAISAATKGTFLVPLVPIGWAYYKIQKWFRKTSTELQRVTSIANSPIFADFSQVLSGTSTIRAYGDQERFFRQCQSSFDKANAPYILVQLTNYWLGLRLDLLGGIISAFIGGVAVATASSDFIPAGWLGLALSYSIEVTNYLKHGVRMMATVEAEMNAVERILFYTNKVEPEAPETIPEKDPPSGSWPTEGRIQLRHASMRYRDGPLVLKDISLTVEGGEKIGVVGRTGSGKSSLMNLLFRICELERDGGNVLIDDVNASEIGTETLRLNLSIIPQDPVMFSNTIRYNLDPFGAATDAELWDVLKKVKLAEVIAALPGGLEEEVTEGGENFSQGQRQLLCIARSLLRKPKILVLDEATASIDNTTDAAIQKMIRENFSDATVLTIAHRLNTIMDSDRILVLDDGRIAEFDKPRALLSKQDGLFKGMVDRSKAAHKEKYEEE